MEIHDMRKVGNKTWLVDGGEGIDKEYNVCILPLNNG